jgi:hypothetical protein
MLICSPYFLVDVNFLTVLLVITLLILSLQVSHYTIFLFIDH